MGVGKMARSRGGEGKGRSDAQRSRKRGRKLPPERSEMGDSPRSSVDCLLRFSVRGALVAYGTVVVVLPCRYDSLHTTHYKGI